MQKRSAKNASHGPPSLLCHGRSPLAHASHAASTARRDGSDREHSRRRGRPGAGVRLDGRVLPGVGRRARAVRSDAPRRQPVWHAPSHCQRACPARCSEPAAAADQASGQPDQRTYREASPHPAAAWRLARADRLPAPVRGRLGKLLRWSSWPPALQAAVHALYPAIIVYQSAQRLRPTDRVEEARRCG